LIEFAPPRQLNRSPASYMNISRFNCGLFLTLSFLASVPGFAQKSQRPRLDSRKPSVYVSFLRFGTREPVYTGESNQRVWLRLHNNTRWPLVLDAHGASGEAFARGTEEEVGLFVSVEEVLKVRQFEVRSSPLTDPQPLPPGSAIEQPIQAQPSATPRSKEQQNCSPAYQDSCHVCSNIRLASGKSIMFSVPREMLCEDRMIYVVYNYDWEGRDGIMVDEPEHRVYFYGSALPKPQQ
jgi:hypothetical protein